MGKSLDLIIEKMSAMLDHMAENPDSVTEQDEGRLHALQAKLNRQLGISEHSKWCIFWQVYKWFDTAKKLAGLPPDETVTVPQNIILDGGAAEMLKLISGTGGTPYSAANAYIFVGNNNTPENAGQSGVIASGSNRAFAGMDSGYPQQNGRQLIYRASFGDTMANFDWTEAAIVNGTGANAVAMNRKVAVLGTKATGTWTLQITISLLDG